MLIVLIGEILFNCEKFPTENSRIKHEISNSLLHPSNKYEYEITWLLPENFHTVCCKSAAFITTLIVFVIDNKGMIKFVEFITCSIYSYAILGH